MRCTEKAKTGTLVTGEAPTVQKQLKGQRVKNEKVAKYSNSVCLSITLPRQSFFVVIVTLPEHQIHRPRLPIQLTLCNVVRLFTRPPLASRTERNETERNPHRPTRASCCVPWQSHRQNKANMSSSTVTKLAGRPNVVLGDNYGDDVDPSRWVVMYPPYIDSVRTEKQVRLPSILLARLVHSPSTGLPACLLAYPSL